LNFIEKYDIIVYIITDAILREKYINKNEKEKYIY
jgi:hypothetical protein